MTVVTFQAVLPLQARGLFSSILSNPILKAVSSHGAIGVKSTLIIMGVIPFLVLAIAVFLNAIPGKIHPKLCEKHYKPCNIASFWKANAMTVGTQWASDLTNSHSCESLQVVAACSSCDHSWLPELHSMDWHLMVLYLENDPEITIPLEELDMLSIIFGYKASYCYMTATEEWLLLMVRSSNLTLSFSSQTSIEEELKRESTADVVTIEPSTPQASCLVMFAYISVALGDTPRLSSFYIASKELYLSCFLYSGSVGFFSAIGVKSTLIIMGVIPFLVLALILRHWPSHSRALPVKNTIEETELVLYAPRGIDKLEPKHVRLIFIDKRKAATEILDEGVVCKKRNQNIELCLAGSSWAALADTLLDILRSLNGCGSEVRVEKAPKSGDVRLAIRLPTSSQMVMGFGEKKGTNSSGIGEIMHVGESDSDRCIIKEKETNIFEGQLLERRSTRLERLRSHHANSLDIECCDVTTFMRETSKNYGAYRMGHLLLEHAARRSLMCHDAFLKFMELEKLTRYSGLDRTTECSLFLPELYYDLGSSPSNVLKRSEFISEASYHLCKIIESVSLDYPFDFTCAPGNVNCSSKESFQGTNGASANNTICHDSLLDSSLLSNKSSFWVRYFWLSGRLSILDGNRSKAHEQFCIDLSLFEKKEHMNDSISSICLPHCKTVRGITIGRILHEFFFFNIDYQITVLHRYLQLLL
ncbi:hypothetical protein KPL71_000441 [Citrus sinensis]|uniref:Uncharacterized protein n=1 Tax=Citrus sinensis TaxID=2711 RepID=A0ACB8NPU8_CITSI|nr:hypothetical protein KPL71_000441 [Citrus sinensis]